MGNNDGIFTREEFIALVCKERLDEAERLALTDFITKKDENSFGQRALLAVDYLATALFGAVGVIVAGQAGMNVVGAALVGCVASLGGGTLEQRDDKQPSWRRLLDAQSRVLIHWRRGIDPHLLRRSLRANSRSFR